MERVSIPTGVLAFAHCRRVISRAVIEQGRSALRVELEPGLGPDAMFHKPTFVVTAARLAEGVVEADILVRRSQRALPNTKPSTGLAFGINESASAFEAVYLCPSSVSSTITPMPKGQPDVLHFSYPRPAGAPGTGQPGGAANQASAGVRANTWVGLKLEIVDGRVRAFVDGASVMEIQSSGLPARGAVGLWVDVGTEAYFSNLHVTS